ncbi:glycerophosphodiester phosphodiesterase family protein [Sinomonas sp. ASV322]|uniref:glycerophosphodiester phosphodiesterase family protein n=1 Tax=Sinomonas sp. ASV322 TaxID=3041920 RepID=UPI0027DCEB45|nr:glycerophosphodiester phosphodiesterase family protein [Sinomonas sp. ASV322]MDQ4501445.1 glycerophosphodiester phosphodiesterase family protein [Sinomonas sp. ASV322]
MAFAHRGFSPGGLENTLTAFRAAWDLGFTHLETDVHATSDGVLVAFHDDTLDRVTDRAGRIAELPWAEVSGARIGGVERVLRFEELAEALPDACLNVDVKAASAVVPFAAAVERLGLHDRVLVASFSDARRRAVLSRLSRPVASSAGMRTTALLAFGGPALPAGVLARLVRDVDCFQVPERQGQLRVVTPRFVERAHALGKQVHVWTVNEPADMDRLLDLGVDGLLTDRADVLRAVLAARGAWPPA